MVSILPLYRYFRTFVLKVYYCRPFYLAKYAVGLSHYRIFWNLVIAKSTSITLPYCHSSLVTSPVSGVVSLVGCELLCGIHRVTSSVSALAAQPLPTRDALCSAKAPAPDFAPALTEEACDGKETYMHYHPSIIRVHSPVMKCSYTC